MVLDVQTHQHQHPHPHPQVHVDGATLDRSGLASHPLIILPISLLPTFNWKSPPLFPWAAKASLTFRQFEIFYKNKMSRRNGSQPKLDLKLNLSPPRVDPRVESPSRSATVSPTSPPSSCVSSEMNQDDTLRYSSSPEATSMVLVGCPRCLMYVMLSEDDPKCPKCKSTVLLDFLHDANTTATNPTIKARRS